MFSLTGRNWKRRWFTLQDGVFRYFEEPMGSGFSGFVPGKGKALWVGDLREAGKGEDGKLKASSGYDSNRQRAVLSVSFGDRLLTLGTAPGEQNAADLGVLATWEAALEEHYKAVAPAVAVQLPPRVHLAEAAEEETAPQPTAPQSTAPEVAPPLAEEEPPASPRVTAEETDARIKA